MYIYIYIYIYNIPGRSVISNCGTPTEKASEFLDFHINPLMQSGWSYIRNSGNFIDKMKRIGKSLRGFLSSNSRCGWSICKHVRQRRDPSIKKQIRLTNLLKDSY